MLFIVGTSSADPPHVSRFLFGSRSSNHSNRQCRRGITKQVETHNTYFYVSFISGGFPVNNTHNNSAILEDLSQSSC